MSAATVFSFVLVGACWGCTTPFIKDGTSTANTAETSGAQEGDEQRKGNVSRLGDLFRPLKALARLKAAIPFLLNQSGSLLYYFLLSSQDISTAVPVCNSLTFVFTAVTAMCLGEKTERPLRTLVGMTLVVVGIAICMASKATRTIQNQLHEDSELD